MLLLHGDKIADGECVSAMRATPHDDMRYASVTGGCYVISSYIILFAETTMLTPLQMEINHIRYAINMERRWRY